VRRLAYVTQACNISCTIIETNVHALIIRNNFAFVLLNCARDFPKLLEANGRFTLKMDCDNHHFDVRDGSVATNHEHPNHCTYHFTQRRASHNRQTVMDNLQGHCHQISRRHLGPHPKGSTRLQMVYRDAVHKIHRGVLYFQMSYGFTAHVSM
jgi:hypothetical protein